jgi:hypothetical protein
MYVPLSLFMSRPTLTAWFTKMPESYTLRCAPIQGFIDNTLPVLYASSLPLSSVASPSASEPLAIFALAFRSAGRASATRQRRDQCWRCVTDDQRRKGGLQSPRRPCGRWARSAQLGQGQGSQRCDLSQLLSATTLDLSSKYHRRQGTRAGSEHVVLRNRTVHLTVAGRRITSLFDVRPKCVLSRLLMRYTDALPYLCS